ncbi:hypothetical protein [Mycobacterium sp.]|uniref:hypothetical protein n=1 Tax=Mycobacterium sp. TaxID=1785 RepID=UPI00122A3597|nr:hypothetical protein [Mycobacterium sp.]TAM66420.1 MAG: hypothetical protein EPN51_16765 [Mycobacterium sp.]
METTACETSVRALLTSSGLSPGPDEVAVLCSGYPAFRALIDALYSVAAARYAEPALRFRAADTTHTDWAP